MADNPPRSPGAGREALMVWLKLGGLLIALAAFGLLIFWLRRLAAH